MSLNSWAELMFQSATYLWLRNSFECLSCMSEFDSVMGAVQWELKASWGENLRQIKSVKCWRFVLPCGTNLYLRLLWLSAERWVCVGCVSMVRAAGMAACERAGQCEGTDRSPVLLSTEAVLPGSIKSSLTSEETEARPVELGLAEYWELSQNVYFTHTSNCLASLWVLYMVASRWWPSGQGFGFSLFSWRKKWNYICIYGI